MVGVNTFSAHWLSVVSKTAHTYVLNILCSCTSMCIVILTFNDARPKYNVYIYTLCN